MIRILNAGLLFIAVSLVFAAAPDTNISAGRTMAFSRAWTSRCEARWSSPITIRTSRPFQATGISAWNNGPAVRLGPIWYGQARMASSGCIRWMAYRKPWMLTAGLGSRAYCPK